MSLPDNITFLTTNWRGGSDGTVFCDNLSLGDIATSAIKQITTCHEDVIYYLKVKYTWKQPKAEREMEHGAQDGTTCTLDLDDDEFITGVEGYSNDFRITQLIFITNKRRSNPHGSGTGEYFKWGNIGTFQGTQVPSMRLLAFSGRTDGYLTALQGFFFDPRGLGIAPSTSNYEGIPAPLVLKENLSSSVPFSTFASHLKSSVITLYVGPDSVELHAHEDTLCKLRFFQAAVQGSFRESVTKSIDMPEDEPSTVSALIEFLYTGNYTYPYDPATTKLREPSGTPVASLMEGQFHIAVSTIASKYGCQALGDSAVRNFEAVMPQLDNLGKLNLWKTAYAEGPDLATWRKGFAHSHSGKQLVSWMKELFQEHRLEIDQTIAELPELASDLLRLSISGIE